MGGISSTPYDRDHGVNVRGMTHSPDNRGDIRDFLISRRARLTPEQVGLPGSGRRRVPGLRRGEVAVLAGVSTEWYTRLEKGNISGVSEEVLDAVARTLRLTEDERTYLFDLAAAARPSRGTRRRRVTEVPPSLQWLLDTITLSAAVATDGCQNVVATNALSRVLFAPMLRSHTVTADNRLNIARYTFLDEASQRFYADWDAAATTTVALLRAEAARSPHDSGLRALVGELCTVSAEFRTFWAAHHVRTHHHGVKSFHHPDVGTVELVHQHLELPVSTRTGHALTVYTAQPGTPSEEKIRRLANWAAHQTRTPARTTDE
ncbi:transcriptional regulator with XRE-family HTH domain [Streptomyces sp. SAI-135]|nr:transcriptional regulator with XRE-family HTH domain [Streptomyces sp. SAI-090]MDH6554251.1 transcriptional regulator with XRE-family HTH domain [Streptomyces sp. SAI-041]MDH6573511.1 transcriptional regulator with XRE-family HTH domain [Streptomyces sp. SAI-117]MDH6581751.1 transcriptional regulator with XRE-family HTH domain [Streptomyces sp. SAI-133]MDH6613754.1 transcriptional regulator with XRE-family HTH domain [Streptomyces sp. SAI-135]